MSRKRKKIKKVQEDEDIFEKLDTQNKALKKIISVLKCTNNSKNQSKTSKK
jgi:hypothetical protein